MRTQSGCFGTGKPTCGQIDDVAEAAAAVNDIVQGAESEAETDINAVALVQLSACYESMRRRIRFLSWALLLLAIFVVCKEMK